MRTREIQESDLAIVAAAKELITKRFDALLERHTVAAAARTSANKLIAGVNVFANCGFGPCAEAVLLGLGATAGEAGFKTLAAVGGPDQGCPLLPPCGNCRQLLIEYCPDVEVILEIEGKLKAVPISELLPFNYKMEY